MIQVLKGGAKMLKIEHLNEPELIFSGGGRHLDPKLGLLLHGPTSWKRDSDRPGNMVRAAAIGTRESLHLFREFLERMRLRIAPAKREPWKRDFPGLGLRSPLHFDICIDQDAEEVISRREEEYILAPEKREGKIQRACEIYETKFDDLLGSLHPSPDIVYVLVSRKLMDETKDPRYQEEKIVMARRTSEKGLHWDDPPIFDFHHFLKVLGFKHRVSSQMIRPSTLEGDGNQQEEATKAWNFAVASYYKATGTPWKLANLDDGTCYVGISFYQEPGEGGTNMRASMAHVYLRSGESQVIRGKPFKWEMKRGGRGKNLSPHLDADQSAEILHDVIGLFKKQQGKNPARVVVHKSSPYTDEEVSGFSSVAEGSYMDLVHIQRYFGVRLFIDGGSYPPLRGTLLWNGDSQPAILYTTGFVPGLGTYLGSGVPEPIAFSWAKKESSIKLLAQDILALTKLDWNNSDFCTALPVTISVSKKVGSILAESRAKEVDPPSMYSYFM
jgi:hypothetical protein